MALRTGYYSYDYETSDRSFFGSLILIVLLAVIAALAINITLKAKPDTRAHSTVLVNVGPHSHGSGVYLGHGYVLTVNHVVESALGDKDPDKIEIKTDDKRSYDATVLWANATYDVALLSISEDANIVPARLACRMPKVGEKVRAEGNPGDVEFISTDGKVTGVSRPRLTSAIVTPMTAPVVWGMSGGPVYDSRGFVLGLNDQITIIKLTFFNQVPVPDIGWFVPAKVACTLMGRPNGY